MSGTSAIDSLTDLLPSPVAANDADTSISSSRSSTAAASAASFAAAALTSSLEPTESSVMDSSSET